MEHYLKLAMDQIIETLKDDDKKKIIRTPEEFKKIMNNNEITFFENGAFDYKPIRPKPFKFLRKLNDEVILIEITDYLNTEHESFIEDYFNWGKYIVVDDEELANKLYKMSLNAFNENEDWIELYNNENDFWDAIDDIG